MKPSGSAPRRRRRPHLSLRSRTMGLTAIGLGSILLTDAALEFDAARVAGRHLLTERADLLASIQAEALAVPLWNLDDDQAGAALDALRRDQDFGQVEILRNNGTVMLSRSAPAQDPAGLPDKTVQVGRTVRYEDRGRTVSLATLRLTLRTDRLNAALRAQMWQRGLVFILLLTAVLAIVFAAFAQLTRPLDLLAGALGRLAAGDRDTPIPALDQQDEIGAVARGLQVFRETAFRLVQAESEYRAVVDHAAVGICRTAPCGRVTSANAALLALLGMADFDEFVSTIATQGASGFYADPARRAALIEARARDGGFSGEVSEIRRADGSIAWISETASAVRDEAGRLLGYVLTVEDITERRRREDEERLRIRAAMESAADAILIADADGVPLFVNRAFTKVLGCTLADLGRNDSMLLQLRRGGETDVATQGGRVLPMAVRVSAISGEDGVAVGSVTICTDLTDRRAAEARILQMAHFDSLTGLPNRTLFTEELQAALRHERNGCDPVAVLCIDLDRFKDVNDTLGHALGDRLLQIVAARLRGAIRHNDVAARIGGDEFVVIQRGAYQPQDAETLAHRLVEDLGRPYELDGSEAVIGASIGIALAPADAMEAEELLRFADLALYVAKAAGRGKARRFSRTMDRMLQQRKATERDLRRALAEDGLVLHYQPQRNLRSGALIGAEALARWTHPERGAIPPAEFIAVAEQCGLIAQLGGWALRQACMEAASWPAGLSVAVNLSPIQLRSPDLVDQVRAALMQSGLEPARLELEITEGVMLRDTSAVIGALHALRDLGVRVALDDFGTGYSSLSYLRRMPIDKIKIDQSFVQALGQEPSALALVRSVIAIAQGLGIESIAEGVETREQALQLLADGCHEAQGWFFGKPMPAQAFRALCQTGMIQEFGLFQAAKPVLPPVHSGPSASPAGDFPAMARSEPVAQAAARVM